MSIATRTGDSGTTGLMYNRRVSKAHPRVEAYGSVDELNAAIGMARASSSDAFIGDNLLVIQKDLVIVMGELATAKEDTQRYLADGFQAVTPALTAKLDALVTQIEAQSITFKGMTLHSAALDVARTTCRRAERRVFVLRDSGEVENHEILIFLNRLSDLLWLMARWVETHTPESPVGTTAA